MKVWGVCGCVSGVYRTEGGEIGEKHREWGPKHRLETTLTVAAKIFGSGLQGSKLGERPQEGLLEVVVAPVAL